MKLKHLNYAAIIVSIILPIVMGDPKASFGWVVALVWCWAFYEEKERQK